MSLIENIADALSSLSGQKSVLDLTQFNDPMAQQVEWIPLKRGGSSFRTHRLTNTDSNRIEVVATKGAVIFALVFLVIGLGAFLALIISLIVFSNLDHLMDLEISTVVQLLIGTIFTGLGTVFYKNTTKKRTFDQSNGYYWEGNKEPREIYDLNRNPEFIALKSIHAIQLIQERVKTDKSYFYSYELNLILTDSSRHNVMDHGNLPKLREDAQQLADFLKIPVWDLIER